MGRLVTFILFFLSYQAFGEDTIRVMHYNLMNYGNDYGECTSSNNNVSLKNQHLATLVEYLQPDILTVNEISGDPYFQDLLLQSVFNTNGSGQYKRGYPPNTSSSPIVNGIFYNSAKLILLSNAAVETNYRDIDMFKFFCPNGTTTDSIILNVVVAHLKAGNGPEDEQERTSETTKLMNHLDNNELTGNFLLCGDLNLYSASEAAFQKLVLHPNQDIRFHDPIDQVGEWHGNAFFAPVHTQSTHSTGGCPAGGGMDDRFDFILASNEITEGLMGVKCISSSYRTVGQDGLRLDQSLVDPANYSVPQEVLQALYTMSDHLPLTVDLILDDQAGVITGSDDPFQMSFNNPASGSIFLSLSPAGMAKSEISLTDICGEIVWRARCDTDPVGTVNIPVNSLQDGLYFIQVKPRGAPPRVSKVIISNP